MISFTILILVAIAITVTSFRRVPGIGVIAALLIIGLLIWLRGDGLTGLGFFPPENWGMTTLWSFLLGVGIQFGSTLLLEPFSDKVTNAAI